MRVFVLSVGLCVGALLPTIGSTQVDQFHSPELNAAAAEWQIDSEVIAVAGLLYSPTRAFRLFDTHVMTQIAVYQGVPVYVDTTLEPWSVIYIPLGRDRMRTYEHRREGDMGAGAVLRAVGTSGTTRPEPARESPTGLSVVDTRWHPTHVQSIRSPAGANGVWLEFGGRRWYSAGTAIPYSPDRFAPIGEYRGFPVYSESASGKDEIWVSVVKDGPIAPYARR